MHILSCVLLTKCVKNPGVSVTMAHHLLRLGSISCSYSTQCRATPSHSKTTVKCKISCQYLHFPRNLPTAFGEPLSFTTSLGAGLPV